MDPADSFDSFAMAKDYGDTKSLEKWERFASSIGSDIVLVFTYSPYLQHERPTERDEYGPTHDVWVESTHEVMGIFHKSLSQSIGALPNSPSIEMEDYVPPKGYGRAGPIWFPDELIRIVVENPWVLALGANVLAAAIYDAMKIAYRTVKNWFETHGVPEYERKYPSVSPFIVKSVVQGHAREFFPLLSPGEASIIPSRPLDADYPFTRTHFLVGLPCDRRWIIYSVDDQLNLESIVRTRGARLVRLRSHGWPRH